MAPIDAELANSNVKPLFFIGTHATLVSGILLLIVRFVYRAHGDTPPALHTRNKHALHRWGVALFSLLFVLSFVVAAYHALAWRYASYVNWASQSHADIPNTLWDGWYASTLQRDRDGTLLGKLGMTGWQLGRWMDDTDLVAETNAASIGSVRGFWWTYQNFVGLTIWSVFVGIEGRHRNVPVVVTLSFILLAQLTSLSAAQNLFFILLLLTPMPLGVPTTKTTEDGPVLVPYHSILSVPALLSFIVLGSLPWLTEYSLFSSVTSLGYFVLPILLATLAQPNSLHREDRYKSSAAARKSYEDVFRVLALASIGLHGYYTFKVAVDQTPQHHYFKHNFVWNSHQPAGNSRTEQAWMTFVTIMKALSENPVIGQVGWDVVLSALSLCIWTVSHGVDVITMLRCSCLAWTLPRRKVPTLEELNQARVHVGEVLDDLKEDITTTALGSPVKRGRGRPRKTSAAIARDHVASSSTSLRRSTRAETADYDETDGEYLPTRGTARQVLNFDMDEPGDLDAAKETEAAGLGWGLFILGGLGAVSASVLGAEASGR